MVYESLTTARERLIWLAENRIVEKLVNSLTIPTIDKVDLAGEIYLSLSEKPPTALEGKTFVQTRNYIITMARTSYFSPTGEFNRKYLRYDNIKGEYDDERYDYDNELCRA